MLIRALIVLLLALNLGVAGWWLLRVPPATPAPEPLPPGVARLQLVGETGSSNTVAVAPAAPSTPAEPTRCVSLGPFANAEAATSARRQLQPLTMRLVARQVYANPPRGWRVFVPPFPSREAVEAAATRAAEAGFSDYFVVREGDEANSLALGRYGNEATARARVATLAAAGLAARAEPIGSGPSTTWLDVAADAAFDPVQAQALTGAARRESLDCSRLADTPQ